MVRLQMLILDMIDTVVVTDSTTSSPAINSDISLHQRLSINDDNITHDYESTALQDYDQRYAEETQVHFEEFRTSSREDDSIKDRNSGNRSCCCSYDSLSEIRDVSSHVTLGSGDILLCSENLLRSSDNLVRSSEYLLRTTEERLNTSNGEIVIKNGLTHAEVSNPSNQDIPRIRMSDRLRRRNNTKYPK